MFNSFFGSASVSLLKELLLDSSNLKLKFKALVKALPSMEGTVFDNLYDIAVSYQLDRKVSDVSIKVFRKVSLKKFLTKGFLSKDGQRSSYTACTLYNLQSLRLTLTSR